MAGRKKPASKKEPDVLSFGGLFKGLESIIEGVGKLKDLAEKTGGQMKTGEFAIPGLGDKAKGVFGFSINTLAGGGLKVEPFGNVRETKAGPAVEEVREPIVDVFEEGEWVRVVAELPGVDESDIKCGVKDDIVTISAEAKQRKYSREVLLPAQVAPESLQSTYKNGILELKMVKKK